MPRLATARVPSSPRCWPTRARGAAPEPVATRLRRLKRSVALAVAVADIAGAWPLERITGTLSRFAAGCIDAIIAAILLQLEREGHLALGGDPQAAAFTVLGMGKLGAGELNYSSDIDLILLYDREAPALGRQRAAAAPFRARLAHAGAADVGGVGRRLRLPHRPAAAARSRLDAARHVGAGRRALLRERRPELGTRGDDQGAARGRRHRRSARSSSRRCGPYIWRRHLDFAAIHDIHSIKRQIDAHRGGGTVKVAGHNVKLGRGGIREIEFFAQTQQLIFGGRNPALRLRGTCETLARARRRAARSSRAPPPS